MPRKWFTASEPRQRFLEDISPIRGSSRIGPNDFYEWRIEAEEDHRRGVPGPFISNLKGAFLEEYT